MVKFEFKTAVLKSICFDFSVPYIFVKESRKVSPDMETTLDKKQ